MLCNPDHAVLSYQGRMNAVKLGLFPAIGLVLAHFTVVFMSPSSYSGSYWNAPARQQLDASTVALNAASSLYLLK